MLPYWRIPEINGLKNPSDHFPLEEGNIVVSDSGNNRIVIMDREVVPPGSESLDKMYAGFSKSMDIWWNQTREKIVMYEPGDYGHLFSTTI